MYMLLCGCFLTIDKLIKSIYASAFQKKSNVIVRGEMPFSGCCIIISFNICKFSI